MSYGRVSISVRVRKKPSKNHGGWDGDQFIYPNLFNDQGKWNPSWMRWQVLTQKKNFKPFKNLTSARMHVAKIYPDFAEVTIPVAAHFYNPGIGYVHDGSSYRCPNR